MWRHRNVNIRFIVCWNDVQVPNRKSIYRFIFLQAPAMWRRWGLMSLTSVSGTGSAYPLFIPVVDVANIVLLAGRTSVMRSPGVSRAEPVMDALPSMFWLKRTTSVSETDSFGVFKRASTCVIHGNRIGIHKPLPNYNDFNLSFTGPIYIYTCIDLFGANAKMRNFPMWWFWFADIEFYVTERLKLPIQFYDKLQRPVYHQRVSWYELSKGFTASLRISHDDVIKWKHFPRNWPFVREIHRSRWIPHTKASDAELWCFLWSASG